MSDRFWPSKINMFVAAGLGVSVAISAYYCLKRLFQQNVLTPPEKWKHVGRIVEIIIYPIKSCGGIRLSEADCDTLGIKNGKCKDRQFMLIDVNGKVVTARTYPKMLKIQPEIVNGELQVNAPNMQLLKINFDKFSGNGRSDIKAYLWDQPVFVTECDIVYYDKWFSQYILGADQGLRFVYYPFPVATKLVSQEFKNPTFRNADTGSLQDVSSYMLINNDSIDDLNMKLEQKVSNLNFRGNFAVETFSGTPYAEDKWNWIRIGENAMFQKVAPCYRCSLTNVDPIAGAFNIDFQPLRTLKTYRVSGKSKDPQMGIQLAIRINGAVNLNDAVYVDEY